MDSVAKKKSPVNAGQLDFWQEIKIESVSLRWFFSSSLHHSNFATTSRAMICSPGRSELRVKAGFA
jgi:hypothetical protein